MLGVEKTKEPVVIFALNFCISNADSCLQFSCYLILHIMLLVTVCWYYVP
jgi:hypothetical protein